MIGRVVNALGEPIDGKGSITVLNTDLLKKKLLVLCQENLFMSH